MSDRLFRGKLGLGLLSALGVLVLLQLVTAGSGDPDGRTAPPGSSYSTNGDGTKAYRQLLRVNDYDVSITRVGFSEVNPDPGSTVIVIGGAELPSEDQAALRGFASAGGRLIVSDQPLAALLGVDLETIRIETTTLEPSFPHPVVTGIERVAAPDRIAYREPGPLLAVIGSMETPSVGTVDIGTGSVWALADPSMVSNDALSADDNAALALSLAGPPVRPVVFAEYNHGYAPVGGFASLPGRWRVALWMAVIAGVVWMVSRGRRLGPPERRSRPLPPPRSAYVAAMATSLARTDELVGATTPIRDRIRRELRRRGGDDAANIARVAGQLQLEPATIDQALRPPGGPDDAIAAGHVLAKLSTNRR